MFQQSLPCELEKVLNPQPVSQSARQAGCTVWRVVSQLTSRGSSGTATWGGFERRFNSTSRATSINLQYFCANCMPLHELSSNRGPEGELSSGHVNGWMMKWRETSHLTIKKYIPSFRGGGGGGSAPDKRRVPWHARIDVINSFHVFHME